MPITRRQSLGLMGSALAVPFACRIDTAQAAKTFRRVGKPVKLGGNVAGTQERVRLAAFGDGGLLVTWTNFNLSTTTVWCQYFRKNRKPIGGPVEIGNAAGLDAGTALEARALTFSDGHALIFFTADRTGASAEEGKQLYVQRMSKKRTRVGKPIRVSSEATGRNDLVFATLLTSGKVMVVWQYQGPGVNLDPVDVHCRVVDPTGKPVTAEQRATKEGRKGRQTPKSIAALSKGRCVFSYVHSDTAAGIFRAACQRLDPTGKKLGAPLILKQTSSDNPYGAGSVSSDLSGRPPIPPGKSRIVKGKSFHAAVYKQAGDGKTRIRGSEIGANGKTLEGEHAISLPVRTLFFFERAPTFVYLEPHVSLLGAEGEPASPGLPRGIFALGAIISEGADLPSWQKLASSTGNSLVLDDGVMLRENADGTTLALGISDSGAAGVHFYFY